MKMTLKQARVLANYTIREVSKKLEFSGSAIRNWEKGNTYPSVDKVYKMAELYGVNYDDIYFF